MSSALPEYYGRSARCHAAGGGHARNKGAGTPLDLDHLLGGHGPLDVQRGGIAELAHWPGNVEGVVHQLGYPRYFLTIAGIGKILGAIGALAPGFPRLKEWAYAGIFSNMTGAAISWAVRGGDPGHLAPTLFLTALTVVSWALRPPNRTLGTVLSAEDAHVHRGAGSR